MPTVRLATFDDTASLVRMHARCSGDSVYKRYATPLARIDDRFARRLLLAGDGALVATVGDEVVGIASISTCKNAIAEVALSSRTAGSAAGSAPGCCPVRPGWPGATAPPTWCCAAAPTTRP